MSPTLSWTGPRHHLTAAAREEFAAIENERRVLQHARKPALAVNVAAMPREAPSRAVPRAPVPRAASVDRGVAPAPGDSDVLSASPELSAQQLGALKEAIYRDLMERIRTDFERGA